MDALYYEIVGADRATVDRLASVITASTGLMPYNATRYAAHFDASDGMTHIGVAPAHEGIGPAMVYIPGPAGQELGEVLSVAFQSNCGWTLRAVERAVPAVRA